MGFELIGVCDAATGRALAVRGSLAGEPVSVVLEGGVGAVLTPVKPGRLFNPFTRRKEALEGLVTRQRMLEAAIATGPFLAAKPGSRLVDQAAVAALLAAHHDGLVEHLASHGPLVQFQLTISWNPQKALGALKDRPAIAAAAQAGTPKAVAQALRNAMAAERSNCQARFLDLLRSASRDIALLPVASENDILNAAVLIAREDEAALDKAVEAIDAEMPDALTIAYRGPSPSLSFAALIVEEPDDGSIEQARQVLDVSQDASVAMLRGAFQAIARRTHPDVGGATQAFREVQAAYATLRAEAEHRARCGAMAGRARLVIRREGDMPWVA